MLKEKLLEHQRLQDHLRAAIAVRGHVANLTGSADTGSGLGGKLSVTGA
jgi:hypothetical protein